MSSFLISLIPRRHWVAALLLGAPLAARAQSVGIGTTTPNAAAVLDITATGKGLLIPRLDSVARTGIATPPDGLMVFQTNGRKGFWYAMGGTWLYIPDKTRSGDNLGSHTATRNLDLGPNQLVGNGGNTGLAITNAGRVGLGTTTPAAPLDVQAGTPLFTSSTGTETQLRLTRPGTSGSRWPASAELAVGAYAVGLNAQSQLDFRLGQNNNAAADQTVLTLRGDGRVGIGTTVPAQTLDVLGTTRTTNAIVSTAITGTGADVGAAVGLGVRADGGLNLGQNTVGHNIAVGYQAGAANTTGSQNAFLGYKTGMSNTTGNFNNFSGYQSGMSNTTGSNNYFSGYGSGHFNTTGNFNHFSGYGSGFNNTTGRNNYFSGYSSGFNTITGSNNQFSGYQSGYSNTTGSNNFFSGYISGYGNSTGSNNQFIGLQSGLNNTAGNNNLFSGYQSGLANTTGSNNTAVGYGSGPTTGALTNAAAFGYNAQVSQSNSLVLGGTGTDAVNVGIGTTSPDALLEIVLPGAFNQTSLKLEHHGSNILMRPLGPGSTTSIIENTAGNLLLNPSATGNVGINQQNPTYRLDVGGSIYSSGAMISLSDGRFKQNVQTLAGALAAVGKLRGVRYQLNALGLARGGQAGEQVGLIAQELETVYPELVSTDKNGFKAINYGQLTPVLVEALKELAARNAALETQASLQQATLLDFGQRLRALEAGGARAAGH